MLMRARERGPGLCRELATATARWWPRALGAAWQGEERTRREAKAAVRARARCVVVHSKQEVARGPPSAAGGVFQRRR